MKLSEIDFEDDAFKACVLASGEENAEDIKELRCRKQKIKSAAGIEHLTNLKLLASLRGDTAPGKHVDINPQAVRVQVVRVGSPRAPRRRPRRRRPPP